MWDRSGTKINQLSAAIVGQTIVEIVAVETENEYDRHSDGERDLSTERDTT